MKILFTALALMFVPVSTQYGRDSGEPMGSPECSLELKPLCNVGQRIVCVCDDFTRMNCIWLCVY